jgi:hypothetical protein
MRDPSDIQIDVLIRELGKELDPAIQFDRRQAACRTIVRRWLASFVSQEMILVGDLVDRMKRWGEDEDGIPDYVQVTYDQAMALCDLRLAGPCMDIRPGDGRPT